ncbi:MAG: hypothetical protein ACREHF_13490 [Rhizomicrobium sp.]
MQKKHRWQRNLGALIAFSLDALLAVPSLAADASEQFMAGQEWTIKPPNKNETTSLHVVIVSVEPTNDQTIVHVSITGIRCPNGNTVSLGHAPIDAGALSKSVDHVIATGVPPAFGYEQSYAHWKADQQGGAWNASVPEIAAMLLQEVGPEKIGCLNQSGN